MYSPCLLTRRGEQTIILIINIYFAPEPSGEALKNIFGPLTCGANVHVTCFYYRTFASKICFRFLKSKAM